MTQLTLDKAEIAFAYKPDDPFEVGSAQNLLQTYDTLHHILRYTITPKEGDSHKIRSSVFDLFKMVHEGKKIDVLDTMHHEMRECVRLQESLIYAPLIQALIESVCRPEDIGGYRVTMPRRDLGYKPPVPPEYVLPRRGRGKKSVA